MHILISNDDGIFAPGIRALSKAARQAGHRVSIFAPDSQRSAASHQTNLSGELHITPVDYGEGIDAWAVDGSPADCVRLGLFMLRDEGVDCVLSGVNKGANRGAAILYSGTVAAAMEGALCGRQAVAVSLCSWTSEEFDESARLGVRTAEWAVKHPLPIGEIYNLNVPVGEIRAVRPASVSHEFICTPWYAQTENGGYKVVNTPNVVEESDENCDLCLTRAGYASLSVLSWNMQAPGKLPDTAGILSQEET